MKTSKCLKIVFGLMVAMLVSSWVLPVLAASSIGVSPKQIQGESARSWFVHIIKPGDTLSDTLVINNSSNQATNVVIEALDALNTTTGGFTLVDQPSQNQDLGLWIKVDRSEVTIPAGGSVEVGFTISVPLTASVGEHSAGIAVYNKPAGASGGMQFKVRVGARVYITVPGQIHRKLTFTKVAHEFKNGKLLFHIQAKNDSNVNIEPTLEIRQTGIRTIVQTESEIGTYLPGSKIDYTATWQRHKPWLGFYRTKIILHTLTTEQISIDGSKKTLPDEQFVYQVSYGVGLVLLCWLIIILLAGWFIYRWLVYRRDQKKFRTRIKLHTVVRGETVMHIAEKENAMPQSIVSFNRLKWPFVLRAGEELFIPTGMLDVDELDRKRQTNPMPSFWQYLVSWRLSLYHPAVHRKLSEKLNTIKSHKPRPRGRR